MLVSLMKLMMKIFLELAYLELFCIGPIDFVLKPLCNIGGLFVAAVGCTEFYYILIVFLFSL